MLSLIRLSRLTLVLVLGLGLAACGPDSDDVSGSDLRLDRPVTEAQALSALPAFGLEGQGRASWTERRFERGGYVFTDFAMSLENGRMRADTLVLTGPRLIGEAPYFSTLSADALTIEAPDGAMRAARMSLSEPSQDLARAIAGVLSGEASLEDLDALTDGYGFAELDLVAPVLQVEDAPDLRVTLSADTVRLSHFLQGERLGSVEIASYAMEGVDEQGQPMAMSVAYLEAQGLSLDGLETGAPIGAALMTPGSAPYELIDLRDLELEAGGVFITAPSFDARIETLSSGVLSSSLALPELRVEPAASHPQSPRIRESFGVLGFDELVLSAAGETRYDPVADRAWTEGDTYIRLQDGLTLSFDQELTGLSAAATLTQQASAETPKDSARLLAPILIHHIRLELTDQSLMARITEQMARQSGLSPAQTRVQLGAMTRMGLAFAGGRLPAGVLQQAADALDGFIASGGVLTIEMDPETPVSAAAFADYPAPDANTLGLRVTHQPGDADAGQD